MGFVFPFIYALFGVACACGLWRYAGKRGSKPTVAAWIALAFWYVIVGAGVAFTWLNLSGLHRHAALVGGIGTLAIALIMGLIVYRLATPGKTRSH